MALAAHYERARGQAGIEGDGLISTTHILKMNCGVTIEMLFNEDNAHALCVWTPEPPFSEEMLREIKKEYVPWRNAIIDDWAKRNNKKVLVYDT